MPCLRGEHAHKPKTKGPSIDRIMGGARGVAGGGAAAPCTLALAPAAPMQNHRFLIVPSPPHCFLRDRFTELTVVLCQTNPSKQTKHPGFEGYVKYRSIVYTIHISNRVCLYVCSHILKTTCQTSPNFLCMSTVAMVHSSSKYLLWVARGVTLEGTGVQTPSLFEIGDRPTFCDHLVPKYKNSETQSLHGLQ